MRPEEIDNLIERLRNAHNRRTRIGNHWIQEGEAELYAENKPKYIILYTECWTGSKR